MKPKEFEKFLLRDSSTCYHCGKNDSSLVPQHRKGRGIGGKNSAANLPSNIITLCSYANGLIESNASFANLAIRKGWKLLSWQDSSIEPVYDFLSGTWFILDDEFNRTAR